MHLICYDDEVKKYFDLIIIITFLLEKVNYGIVLLRREFMKLIIVRHADPDYSIDSLTESGWKEAEALKERFQSIQVDSCYVSPLGRARDTARVALEGKNIEPVVKDWLREFNCPVKKPRLAYLDEEECVWDWFPVDWTARPVFFDKDRWMYEPELTVAGVSEKHEAVIRGFDELLKEHGYERDGMNYRAVNPSHETVVLFCHFGLKCVLLAHLMNISPMILWHSTCCAPSGVTVLNTEEREEGIAAFRMASYGDISHLYQAGLEPSFHARFCECYTDDTWH